MNTQIIEAEIIQPNRTFFSRLSRAQWVDIAIISPVVIFLMFAGVCNAYDLLLTKILEDNYANAVTAEKYADKNYEAARTAHCSALSALVERKKETNQPIKGTDTECDILQ